MRKVIFSLVVLAVFVSLFSIISFSSWYSPSVDIGNSDLIGYWEFESVDASNVTSDSSGYGNDGTLKGYTCDPADCSLITSRYGNGINFDGFNDYILMSNPNVMNYSYQDNFTISLWINPNNISDAFIVSNKIGTGNTAGFLFQTENAKIKWRVYNGTNSVSETGNTVLSLNTWYHVVHVQNMNTSQLFVNGMKDTTSDLNVSIGGNAYTTVAGTIGTRPALGTYWNGSIDDVRIYNRSLSDSEIKELYSCRVPDSGGWTVNGNCNINSEEISKPSLSLNIESTGVINMINTSLVIDRITIANGGMLVKDENSTYVIS